MRSSVRPFCLLGVLMHPWQWLDLKTVAKSTGIPYSTLRRWAAEENWPHILRNGIRCYRASDINNKRQRFLRRHLTRRHAA